MTTQQAGKELITERHQRDGLLRAERLPHIWCPGCGLGVVTMCYADAVEKSGIPLDRHVCISGIGCTGRVSGYLHLDTYHTTHGRGIAFGTGMKVAKPELEVTVIGGDGDFFNIGGNHIIHAARRNMDINAICVNNFNYGMTGGQHGSTTPIGAKSTTTPYGNIEPPFNIPYVMAALGASFVARWTTLHVRQLSKAIRHAMEVDGFAFIEIISPCPPTFGELNAFPEGLDEMKYFREYCVVDDDADLSTIGITMKAPDPLVVGNFVDVRRPSFQQLEAEMIRRVMEGRK